MKRNQWKWLAVSVGFSVAVLIIVLYFTIDETTISYLQQLDPKYLFLALGLHMASLCFWALRMQQMARPLGYRVGFWCCLNAVLANLLVAAITPSQAGGEPVRIHELYRADVKLGDATAVVIMERVLDGIVLGIIGAVAMLLLVTHWSGLQLDIAVPMMITWGIVTAGVLLFAYSVKNPEFLKRVIKRISKRFTKRWGAEKVEHLTERIDSEVDTFHNALSRFVGHARSGLVWGVFFTTLYWFSEFFIASLILMGLGQPPYLVESFIVQIVIAILMMIPLTPGSSGVAELSATSLYSMFIPSSIVGIFVVIWRLILYYFNILIGVLAAAYIVRREMIFRKIGINKDKNTE